MSDFIPISEEDFLRDVPFWELNAALRGLYLAEHEPDLVQRAFTIARMDAGLVEAEEALLRLSLEEERVPAHEGQLLSAQSEAWLVYVSEMLRTWRALLADIDRLAETDALESEIHTLNEQASRGPASWPHRLSRRLQLLKIAREEKDLRARIREGLLKTQDLTASIEALRETLERGGAMHGERPRLLGLQDVSPESGAVTWVLFDESGHPSVRLSRRAVADMLRLMGE